MQSLTSVEEDGGGKEEELSEHLGPVELSCCENEFLVYFIFAQ